MKKVIYVVILTLFFTVLSSCKIDRKERGNLNREILIKDFPREENLTAEYIGPSDFFLLPTEIGVFDSVLFVIDFKKEEKFFYFFKKTNFEFIGSAVNRGRGPDEFGSVEFFHQYNKRNIWILDPIGRRFSSCNIDSMLVSQNHITTKSYNLHPDLGIVLSMFYISDSLLVGTSRNGFGRLFLWNPQNDSIEIVKNFPEIKNFENIPQRDLKKIYHSYNGIKPDNSLIVSALDLFKRIDIFTSNGDLFLSLLFSEYNKLEYLPSNNKYYEKTIYQYLSVFTTDKFIYALYYGDKLVMGDFSLGNQIFTFDWEGNPICKYILDVPIFDFTVDESNETIYGLRPFDNNPIVIFKK